MNLPQKLNLLAPANNRVNPRPAEGGLNTPTSCIFFGNSEKRRGAAPPFCTAYQPSFPQLPENLAPRLSQVRSPGQAKWPHPIKSSWCYSSCGFWAINMEISGYHKTISSYKMYISDFSFLWLKVRSILCLPSIRQKEKNQIPPICIRPG